MRLFTGSDRHMTPKQKLAQLERAEARLRAAQGGKVSKLGRKLQGATQRMRKQEKQTRKGLALTKQAYL